MPRAQTSALLSLVAGALLLNAAWSQQPGITRLDLLRKDLSGSDREIIQVRVDFAPGVGFPSHSHPGEEIAYVIEGVLEYQLGGRAPVTVKAGQTLFIPAGTIHSAQNVGTGNASELATYIVQKDKPLVLFSPGADVNH